MRVDRVLLIVEYVTWLPADERLARQGQLAPDAKIKGEMMLWAPYPVDERGQGIPDKLPPDEQGVMWAQKECIRLMKKEGREVLAIMGTNNTGIVESLIKNQPKEGIASDLGLSKSALVTS